jgi:hypothetical protein
LVLADPLFFARVRRTQADDRLVWSTGRGQVLKHPEIDDYSLSVTELDEKEYLNMRLVLRSRLLVLVQTPHIPNDLAARYLPSSQSTLDLRNNMAIIYDRTRSLPPT